MTMDGNSKRYRESDVLDFIRGNDTRGDCFGRWPDNILEPYLRFSAEIGALYLIQEGGELVGLGIAMRLHEGDLDRHWIPQDQAGDSIEFTDVICKEKRAMATLVDEFASRHPDWRECKLWAIRHGQRKRVRPEILDKVSA